MSISTVIKMNTNNGHLKTRLRSERKPNPDYEMGLSKLVKYIDSTKAPIY